MRTLAATCALLLFLAAMKTQKLDMFLSSGGGGGGGVGVGGSCCGGGCSGCSCTTSTAAAEGAWWNAEPLQWAKTETLRKNASFAGSSTFSVLACGSFYSAEHGKTWSCAGRRRRSSGMRTRLISGG